MTHSGKTFLLKVGLFQLINLVQNDFTHNQLRSDFLDNLHAASCGKIIILFSLYLNRFL